MIRYVVNTNHHMAYAGGLRTYFSQGTTVVTHQSNRDYYVDILFSPFPRTVDPDHMTIFNPMYMISRRPAVRLRPWAAQRRWESMSSAMMSASCRSGMCEAYGLRSGELPQDPRPSLARGNHSAVMLMPISRKRRS